MISSALQTKIESLVLDEFEKDGWIIKSGSCDLTVLTKGDNTINLLASYLWVEVNEDEEDE